MKENPITLMEERRVITEDELRKNYSGKIAALDFYIKGIEEKGHWDGDVLCLDGILNIDHHAPVEEFVKYVSSTNLAIAWVKKNGILDKNYTVVLNHTDCDSLLSSFVIRGIFSPYERFGEAAIAADHTGEENEIADLLQALQYKRDLEFSVRNLKLLLEGKDLEAEAQKLLEKTFIDRKKAREIVEGGGMINLGGIIYAQLDKKVESSYFPALIPNAHVILLFSPHEKNIGNWEAKIRLGMAAPSGLTLSKLEIEDFDPSFGYRWNAGGNNRGSGTSLSVKEYAQRLNVKLQKFLASKK